MKRKEPYLVTVRIGKTISLKDQKNIGKPKDFKRYLQSKIYSLGSGLKVKPFFLKSLFERSEQQQAIAKPQAPELISQEIESIRKASIIASQGEYDILEVKAKDIPCTLKEIGRLREKTFSKCWGRNWKINRLR